MLSFQRNIEESVRQTNYEWLLFYPCFYLFVIWDGYREYINEKDTYSFLPFALSAYMTTIALIFSSKVKIMGVLIGPVWLPMLFCIIRILIGMILKSIVEKV